MNVRTRLASVVVALLLTSCATGEWTGDVASPSVGVIGDSLVFQSERSETNGTETLITDALVAEGLRAWVTGWTGLTVKVAYPYAWSSPSRLGVVPDILVIALGSNDMHVDAPSGQPYTTPEAARPLLRAWLSSLPATCVRLIGVAESITEWGLDVTAPPWNAMLAEEAALHGNAEYVPWIPDPSWTGNGASPHLTLPGRDAYRDLIVASATSCVA